jgi:Xaa-Pro aminopeptidase
VSGLRGDLAEPLRTDVRRRWGLVRQAAALRGCEGLLVVSRADRPGDLLYLAGHRPGMAGHVTRGKMRGRGYGALWMPLEGAPVLMVTTPFYEGGWTEQIRIGTDFPAMIGQTLRDAGAQQTTVGLVGEDVLSVLLFREVTQHLAGVRWVVSDDLVMGIRAQKSAYEIECLRRGSHMADRAGERLYAHLQPGLRERDVAAFITRELLLEGAEVARATCQSGVERSGEPLAYPTASERVLQSGDMVHMEINGQADGYLIDICRSTVIGPATPEQRRLLRLCLEMLEASVAATRPGIPAASLSEVAGRIAATAHLGGHFSVDFGGPGTFLGHGIGVANDEPPVLGLGDQTPLLPGMLLTIEPGLYRTPVGGCRIEDEVLVTDTGAEVLTKLARVWWD